MSTVAGSGSANTEAPGVPPLNTLYFYLTEGCNLACRHCWLAPKFDPEAKRHPVLPVELFETAIREAKPLGLSGVKLTGGEPLLHPEIVRLLEIARREELRLTIETNGVLCTPELAAEIAKSPGAFVSVSLDGADAATHDWVRGVPGAFERALQGARHLAAAGLLPQIIMSLLRVNADQVEAVVRLAETLGAGSVKFNVIQPTGRGEKIRDGDSGLPVAELVELGRRVDMELAPTTKLALHFDYPLAFKPLSRIGNSGGRGVCGILGIMGVLATGYYALCGIGEHVPELVFGRIDVDDLAHLWYNTRVLMGLRTGLPGRLEGVCGRCLMRGCCLGSCVAQNYYRSRRLWAPFWFCEEAEAVGLFPETRLSAARNPLRS